MFRNILAYERYVMGENWRVAIEEANVKRRGFRRYASENDDSDDDYGIGGN